MSFYCLFALCFSLLAVSPSYAGSIYGSNDQWEYLPVGGNLPGFRVIEWTILPEQGNQYMFFLNLDLNETYRIDTPGCDGCRVMLALCYPGGVAQFPDCWPDTNKDYFLPQTADGTYFFQLYVPVGRSWFFTIVHEKHVNGQTIPSLLFYRIYNPDPTPPSSTGPAVEWPLGHPTGLFIADGVSSAFLPRNDGWSWIEYDRDLSNYTLTVGFVTHLMTMDAFWIDPTFGDASYVATGLNHTITPGTWFGSWDDPITDEFTNFDYHFTIPLGGIIEITLHYIYQMPGESFINNQTVHVVIGNFFGMDPNESISPSRSAHRQDAATPFDVSLPESEHPLSITSASALSAPSTQDKLVVDSDAQSAAISANDASHTLMRVWMVCVCVLASAFAF